MKKLSVSISKNAVYPILPIYLLLFFNIAKITAQNLEQQNVITNELRYKAIWNIGANKSDSLRTFCYPRVKIDRAGNLYVLDLGNNRLLKYDSTGKVIWVIGKIGHEPGNFIGAWKLDIGHDKVYVLEGWNKRMQIFDNNGKHLRNFKIEGHISDFAVDMKGLIYIANGHAKKLISVFNESGKQVEEFGDRIQVGDKARTETYNEIRFDVSEDGVSYIAFVYNPSLLLRKYNASRTLADEIKLDNEAFYWDDKKEKLLSKPYMPVYVQKLVVDKGKKNLFTLRE